MHMGDTGCLQAVAGMLMGIVIMDSMLWLLSRFSSGRTDTEESHILTSLLMVIFTWAAHGCDFRCGACTTIAAVPNRP